MTDTTTTKAETTTKTKAPKTRPATFSLEAVEKIVGEALAKQRNEFLQAMAAQQAEARTASNGKSERSMQNEIAVVKAFKAKGFGLVKPHEDVKTFGLWGAAGYRPLEGSKSVKVKNLRLFHRSQVRELSRDEKQAMVEQSKAAIDRYVGAAVIPITGANPQ